MEKDNFLKQFRIDNKPFLFKFSKVFISSGVKYYVTAINQEDNKTLLFQMEERNGKWTIVDAPKVPGNLHKISHMLHDTILKYEQ